MTTQLLRESSIEVGERKLLAIFDSYIVASEQLDKPGLSNFSAADLNELFKLNTMLSNKKNELVVRREHLLRARESFIQALSKYDEYVISEIDQSNTLNQRFNGRPESQVII